MLSSKIADRVSGVLGPHLPGLTALIDIADAKRRNLYLGHRRVDDDIQKLDELAAELAAPDGAACRVSGDQWLYPMHEPRRDVNGVES